MHALLRYANYSTAQDTAQGCHTSASDNIFCIKSNLHKALLATAAVCIQGTSIISRDDKADARSRLPEGKSGDVAQVEIHSAGMDRREEHCDALLSTLQRLAHAEWVVTMLGSCGAVLLQRTKQLDSA